MTYMNLWLIFLTGLTTGGLSCLAMQGGLLASMVANSHSATAKSRKRLMQPILDSVASRDKQKGSELAKPTDDTKPESFDKLDWQPVLFFLLAKLAIHTVLGFLLGALGAAVTLSLGVRLAFQLFSAFFMFATAMNLLNVHPIFRFVQLQPPKFIARRIRNSTKSKAFFAPVVLGMLTVFIPCGVTQAMAVLAMNTGSSVQGALLMFAFVLGTSPLFAIVGVATAKLSEGLNKAFLRFAAYALLFMALYGFNGVLEVQASPLAFSNVKSGVVEWLDAPAKRKVSGAPLNQAVITGNVQKIAIEITSHGYTPNKLSVKQGIPVELTLQSKGAYSCAADFVIRQFNIREFLGPTDTRIVRFTPTQKGRIPFSCSMGMYTGVIEVM